MRINLLKRLESSVDSFRLTLEGIIGQIENAIKTIQKGNGDDYEGIHKILSDENYDFESNWADEEQVIGKKIKVHIADMDTTKWQEDLNEDLTVLNHLWGKVVDITGANDAKLQSLVELLNNRLKNRLTVRTKRQ